MKKKMLLRCAAVILLAIAWIALRGIALDSVEVAHPTRGPAVLAVYATGTVEATVMLPIAPRISAKLAELNVDEGSRVTKGQVLARLEDADLQSTMQQLQAQESLAKQNYERAAALIKTGFTTKASYDSAKAAWEAAQALTAKASAEANFMKLLAPDDGLIIKRDGEIGQLLAAQQPVFWMSCCAPLRISAEVNEEDIAHVKQGQDVLIRADAFPDEIFKGRVQAITPKGDPIARTYRVRIALLGEVPLHIGMTAETNIIIEKDDNALLVPSSALRENTLWLVRDGMLVQQSVQQGAKGLKSVAIRSGVTEKDLVVLHPFEGMTAGASVRTKQIRP